jgi:uncharacterized protein (DUF1810 family)
MPEVPTIDSVWIELTSVNLDRFVGAHYAMWDTALQELTLGHKVTHWMWFIFPQAEGLGRSPVAQFFALRPDEVEPFIAHPMLGPNLLNASRAVYAIPEGHVTEVFGTVDRLKLRSSMTLFARALHEPDVIFDAVIDKHFGGHYCEKTIALFEEDR